MFDISRSLITGQRTGRLRSQGKQIADKERFPQRKGERCRNLPRPSGGYGIRWDEYVYLSLRRRINSATPTPARPTASNPTLSGSGTGTLGTGWANAWIGLSKTVATKKNFIAAPPQVDEEKAAYFIPDTELVEKQVESKMTTQ